MDETNTERHSEQDYLDAIEEHSPAGTSEVADILDVSPQEVYDRLTRMEADGRVQSKMTGQSLVWFLPENTD